MGIKNLKSLLLENKSLTLLEDDSYKIYNGIFVDTMSIYIAVANCVRNLEELTTVFIKYVNGWIKKGGHVTLFIDRGTIKIKQNIRDKRRESSKLTKNRKILELERYKSELRDDTTGFMEDEIKAEMQLKIDKLTFQIFLSDSDNIKTSLNEILSHFNDNEHVTMFYCDARDAEFVMCIEAKKHLSIVGEWPLIISTDQDTMLFASVDRYPKMIKNLTQLFKFIPTSEDNYLAKLTALVNGCDFFPGLYGASITLTNLKKIQLFSDFTIDNIVTSLAIKNYYRKTRSNVDVREIITFINSYANLEDIYSYNTPCQCTIQEFIFSALDEKWNEFKSSYLETIPLPCQLMYALEPRREISTDDVKTLSTYIDFDNTKSDIDVIKSISSIFGYLNENCNTKVFGIYKNDILLCANNSFYFNDSMLISNIKSDNIINIGY
ncbi:fen1-like nuclease [Raccoonpox virus]|uniref:Putative nuclease OPG089 n=1 Tax=Raccoon poxvirus TaxID=10256 RepID=A0A0G3G4D5_RACVI|nr:FEN1-like nuclease [Raccoonpox virus]AKJ93711.1 FEN1-like nuclease [Raccoonpox virus]AOP31343.1 fen1-like nuclease [Raccoonpox virus]